jgi:hypothetical protein
VLTGSRSPTVREYGPFDPGDCVTPSRAEEAALRDRLRGMGYLE